MKSPRPATILVTAATIAVAYGFPGYMNWDATDQLHQARVGIYSDWHAPLMARYWHVLDRVFHGPLPMLVLQIALFLWGAYGLFRKIWPATGAALAAALLLLFPPVLVPMAVTWKDAQMASWLIAGTMLCLQATPRARIGGLICLFCAAGVRDNGCAALPPILLLAVASWGFRRKLAVCGVALALFVAITGASVAVNRAITDQPMHAWSRSNAIHDIAGMICLGEPMTDDEIRTALAGIPLVQSHDLQRRFCTQYDPRWWFALSFSDDRLFETVPTEADRAARSAAYFRLVRARPGVFLKHRWKVMAELLGLTEAGTEQPVCQTFAGQPFQLNGLHHDASLSWFQHLLGNTFVKLSNTLLWRPWAYALLALACAIYAVRRRSWLVLAIATSGLSYEVGFSLGAASPSYRYSHWMVVCAVIAAVLVFTERYRSARA